VNGPSDLTLRDYFAGQIVPALVSHPMVAETVKDLKSMAITGGSTPTEFESSFEFPMYASVAYRMADAMLAARGQKQ
jgi:hypothetical protein